MLCVKGYNMSKMSTKVLEIQEKDCKHDWDKERHVCCPECFKANKKQEEFYTNMSDFVLFSGYRT